MLAETDTGDIW